MRLILGMNDIPYALKVPEELKRVSVKTPRGGKARVVKSAPSGSESTGDVAEILENRYHVMEIFFETVGREQISTALEHSIAGAIENMNVGQPIGSIAPTAEAEGEIETAFRFFLSQREMDMLHRGVPTRAAVLGINHRLLHPYARSNPPRPSFIDTGLYQANMRAKFEE